MLIGLDGPRAIVLWWTLPAYMFLIGCAVLVATAILAWRTRGLWSPRQVVDALLLASLLGLVMARAQHVMLNWAYFQTAASEIMTVSAGGLETHGAIIGAALGGYCAARWFGTRFDVWLGGAAFALPLIALAAWWGCAAANCAYGAEVAHLADYPRWLVWEAPGAFLMTAPRYAVQPLGMTLSLLVLLITTAAAWRGFGGVRLAGLALFGIMLGHIALGLLRGDPASYAQLSVMLVLDVAFALGGVLLLIWPRRVGVLSA